METPVTPVHRRFEFVAVAYVAFDALKPGLRQPAQITAPPEKRLHVMSTRRQLMHEVRADKARGAGDEAVHTPAMICVRASNSNQFWHLTCILRVGKNSG